MAVLCEHKSLGLQEMDTFWSTKKTQSCAYISTINHQRDDYKPCQGNAGKEEWMGGCLSSPQC